MLADEITAVYMRAHTHTSQRRSAVLIKAQLNRRAEQLHTHTDFSDMRKIFHLNPLQHISWF